MKNDEAESMQALRCLYCSFNGGKKKKKKKENNNKNYNSKLTKQILWVVSCTLQFDVSYAKRHGSNIRPFFAEHLPYLFYGL